MNPPTPHHPDPESTTPRVSIAMPAYNAARTIGVAIDSVLAQTFTSWELVICDDAARDGTYEAIQSRRDPRIRVLRNEQNLGEGATRDRAIAAGRAAWTAVLDADDAWLPERLERLFAGTGGEECLVFDDLMRCHDTPGGLVAWQALRGSRAFGANGGAARDVTLEDFIRSDRLLIKPLFPTRLVREFGITHGTSRFGADTEFFLQLMSLGLRLRYVPAPLYLYRLTPGSATANPQRHRLMRECVERAGTLPGFGPAARAALGKKIASLRRNEIYAGFSRAVREKRWAACVHLVLRNPWIVLRAARRVVRNRRYQAHRRRHSGRGRGTGS
jgi:succinoglycan biosynthesis protein ExoO